MPPITTAIGLLELRDRTGLVRSDRPDFFTEWRNPDISLDDTDLALVQRLMQRYRYYLEAALMQEEAVKMTLLSPLLERVGFYDPPFRTEFEQSIALELPDPDRPDGDLVYQGRIDILVVLNTLWVLTIESKNMRLSVENGIGQLLAYMLKSPNRDRPSFGLLTNGSDFVFAKLDRNAEQQLSYDLSRKFSIQNDGDLAGVLRVLRQIETLALT